MLKLRLDQYLSLTCVVIGLLLLPVATVSQPAEVQPPAPHLNLSLISPAPLPKLKIASESGTVNRAPQVSAAAVYVIDLPSSAVLLEKNSEQLLSPASTTKLLTALVAIRLYDLNEVIEVKSGAFTTGTTMHLRLGEKISVRNLLHGLLIASGNDAALVLANHHPQGYQGFINEMNKLASELNFNQTNFTNPSGLDGQEHFTSAHDLALITKEITKNELLKEIVGTKELVVTDESGQITHNLRNTHALLGVIPGVVGIKTGTTELAGETLITQVEIDQRSILIVLMGSHNRYAETKEIIDWIWSSYEWVDIAGTGRVSDISAKLK